MCTFNLRLLRITVALLVSACAGMACRRAEKEPAAIAAVDSGEFFGALAPADQVRIVGAPDGADVAEVVRDARARAKSERRELLVYVGATWCEPCKRFHEAANRGELDKAFPNLTLIEFDLDRDRERLLVAGYTMKMIPYFDVPNEDGRASPRKMEGSVKGEGAVSEIAPRLRALVVPGG